MVQVKQFIDPSEENLNEFFATTVGRLISFNQSSSTREVTVEGYRKIIPSVIINIVYENKSTGGMHYE